VNKFVVYWNSSEANAHEVVSTVVNRLEWKALFGSHNDFQFANVPLLRRTMNKIFRDIAPMLVSDGIVAIVPLLITQPIVDMTGEVRPYMVSCTLSLLSYWSAAFVVDWMVWILTVTLIWAVFLAAQIASFVDNALNLWYSIVMNGPCFILMVYCCAFLFQSPETASRQSFLVMMLVLLIPVIVGLVAKDVPHVVEWIYACLPVLHVQRLLDLMLMNVGIWKRNLGYYWKDPGTKPFLVMQWADIVIYAVVLRFLEFSRMYFQRKAAKKSFGDYGHIFKQEKAKHPVTPEARAMEEEVENTREGYAVRIENCSRLFFNTSGRPIPAVNCVSLGVKEGSLFGFLGANGAGKTTLIKMITSMLPTSDGTIEIMGRNIADYNDSTLLSVCPQFNTHLCNELTPYEHFVIYSMFFQLNRDCAERETDRLMTSLELHDVKNKPIQSLSSGDVRKLAIAISFLGPAKIILLDEPTASLDPVARHRVHEMITSFKGEKTFNLCTHLLSEAEALCDNISIMIKGCVYTVGSPGYLSDKFGTAFKVDVMLTDESEERGRVCDRFFAERLPMAVLSIRRPKARIYNVPATTVTLSELFAIMDEGKQSSCAFSYYTCSSSSLERVFMEIVRMSEYDDVIRVGESGDAEPALSSISSCAFEYYT
jgi:ABC-type multidrug transport system ATPase subunit